MKGGERQVIRGWKEEWASESEGHERLKAKRRKIERSGRDKERKKETSKKRKCGRKAERLKERKAKEKGMYGKNSRGIGDWTK